MNYFQYSILELFLNSHIIVQSVIIILIIFSIISWSIIIIKIIDFSKIDSIEREFIKIENNNSSFENFLILSKKNKLHIFSQLFLISVKEWKISSKNTMHKLLLERLENALQISINKSMSDIEKYLSYLALISSTAPFIGLFGTIFGIINSFTQIGANNNFSIDIIAPGIAEALFATAIGIFAAIPALLAYNIFNNKINYLYDRMQNLSKLIINIFSRELDVTN